MTENKSYDYIQGHLGHMTSQWTSFMIVDKLVKDCKFFVEIVISLQIS